MRSAGTIPITALVLYTVANPAHFCLCETGNGGAQTEHSPKMDKSQATRLQFMVDSLFDRHYQHANLINPNKISAASAELLA